MRSTSAPIRTFIGLANSFNIVISTVPGNVDLDAHLALLARDGVLVTLAILEKPPSLSAKSLLDNRRSFAGTRSGGIAETREMLDFYARHAIGGQVEVIGANAIDAAYPRVMVGDVRYRFVIDIGTIAGG